MRKHARIKVAHGALGKNSDVQGYTHTQADLAIWRIMNANSVSADEVKELCLVRRGPLNGLKTLFAPSDEEAPDSPKRAERLRPEEMTRVARYLGKICGKGDGPVFSDTKGMVEYAKEKFPYSQWQDPQEVDDLANLQHYRQALQVLAGENGKSIMAYTRDESSQFCRFMMNEKTHHEPQKLLLSLKRIAPRVAIDAGMPGATLDDLLTRATELAPDQFPQAGRINSEVGDFTRGANS